MKCTWGNCPEPTFCVFIMGCGNMHIAERPFCATHSILWAKYLNRDEAACHECWATILAYETVPARQVTHLVNPVPA